MARAAAILAVCVALSVQLIHAREVVRWGGLVQTTGVEAPGLYGIYRVATGDALYQRLVDQPTTMLFNAGFYQVHGRLARAAGVPPASLPVFSRLLTAVLTLLLTVAAFRLAGAGLPRGAVPDRWLIAAWLGIGFFGPMVSWWSLTARPDLPAAACEAVGVLILLTALGDGARVTAGRVAAFTLACFAAWSFKQTFGVVYAGALVVLWRAGHGRAAACSALAFLAGAAGLAVAAGPFYFQNTVLASALSPWSFGSARDVAWDAVRAGGPVLLPAGILTAAALVSGRWTREHRVLLGLGLLSAVAGHVLAAKDGGSRNYLFSAYAMAVLIVVRGVSWTHLPGRARSAALLAGAVGTIVVAGIPLLRPGLTSPILLTAPEAQAARAEVAAIGASRKPVFVQNALWALPWVARQHPSDVMDWTFYRPGRDARLIEAIEAHVVRHEYAEAFVFEGEWLEAFEREGYRREGRVGRLWRLTRP